MSRTGVIARIKGSGAGGVRTGALPDREGAPTSGASNQLPPKEDKA